MPHTELGFWGSKAISDCLSGAPFPEDQFTPIDPTLVLLVTLSLMQARGNRRTQISPLSQGLGTHGGALCQLL